MKQYPDSLPWWAGVLRGIALRNEIAADVAGELRACSAFLAKLGGVTEFPPHPLELEGAVAVPPLTEAREALDRLDRAVFALLEDAPAELPRSGRAEFEDLLQRLGELLGVADGQ